MHLLYSPIHSGLVEEVEIVVCEWVVVWKTAQADQDWFDCVAAVAEEESKFDRVADSRRSIDWTAKHASCGREEPLVN